MINCYYVPLGMVLPTPTKPKSRYVNPSSMHFSEALPMDLQAMYEPWAPSNKELEAAGLTREKLDALMAEL